MTLPTLKEGNLVIRLSLRLLSCVALAAGVVAAPVTTSAQTPTLIVGALHVGSVNDNGYNQAMHEGLLNMQANVPGIKLLEAEQVAESADSERVMENMIGQGAKLVFPQSFGYLDPALNVAARHPEVTFEHPAGYKQSTNLGTFWSDTTSFEYLMGMVAGKSTKTNKLGWIIGFPIPNILTSINAFQLGALSVNPQATTQVIVNNTWVDPAKEAEAVNALADSGVDVVTMIVDSPSAVIQTAEQRGIMSMGFHCLCAQTAAGDHWLTGIGFTWGPLFTRMAQSVIDGTWQSKNDVGDLASGYAALAPYGPLVSDDTKALVDKTRASLTSGDTQVFKGPIYDNTGQLRVPEGQVGNYAEFLQKTDWLVQGATGQIS